MINSFGRRLYFAFLAVGIVGAAMAAWLLFTGINSAGAAPPVVDHFKCYQVQDLNPPAPATVTLTDQFESQQVSVQRAVAFCNPVQKTLNMVVTPITNPDSHITVYDLAQPLPTEPVRTVLVNNQFGNQQLTVTQPLFLAVPTLKQPFAPPHDLDHFKCYQASGQPVNQIVDLQDQFHPEPGTQVLQPDFFCNPTGKIHGAQTFLITNPAVHMVCYRITAPPFGTNVIISNQFVASDNLNVFTAQDLCVPSQKLLVNTPTPAVTNSPTPSPTPACTDTDGDGICDSTDNCPDWPNPTQALPAWPVPAGDTDCDGFPNTVAVPQRASEAFLGTDAMQHCAANNGLNNEGLPDRWPVDFNDDQLVSGGDLLAFAPVYGRISPDPVYLANVRFNINGDDRISGGDLLVFGPYFGRKCA